MDYNIEDTDKILGFASWSDKQKIDELLRIDCSLYAGLGMDSTKADKELVKRGSRKIYKAIKEIDNRLGKVLLEAMDL